MTTSNSQSSAIYEAVLIDKITAPAENIKVVLKELQDVLKDTNAPIAFMNSQIASIGREMDAAGKRVKAATDPLKSMSKGAQVVQRAFYVGGQAIGNFTKQLGIMARTAGYAGTALTVGLVGAIYKMTQAAGRAREEAQLFSTVFGNSAGDAEGFIERFAGAFGQSEYALKSMMAQGQQVFLGMGATAEQALGTVEALVMAANEVAAAKDMNLGDVFSKMLVGEEEPLRRLGFDVRVKNMEEYMKSIGDKRKWKDLNGLEQQLTKIAFIVDKTRILEGQAASEREGWSASVNRIYSQFTAAVIDLGEAFIKVLLPAVQRISKAMVKMRDVIKAIPTERIEEFVKSLALFGAVSAGLVAAGIAMFALGQAILVVSGLASAFFTIMGGMLNLTNLLIGAFGGFAGILGGLTLGLTGAGAGVAALMAAFGALLYTDWSQVFSDLVRGIKALRDVSYEAIQGLFTAIATGNWQGAWDIFIAAAAVAFVRIKIMFFETLNDMLEGFRQFLLAGTSKEWGRLMAAQIGTIDLTGMYKDAGKAAENFKGILEAINAEADGFQFGDLDELKDLKGLLNQVLGIRDEARGEIEAGDTTGGDFGGRLSTLSSFVASNADRFGPTTDATLEQLKAQTALQQQMVNGINDLNNKPAAVF